MTKELTTSKKVTYIVIFFWIATIIAGIVARWFDVDILDYTDKTTWAVGIVLVSYFGKSGVEFVTRNKKVSNE